MKFRFSSSTIDPEVLRRRLRAAGAGGFVSFEGRVRDRNRQRKVRRLEYEAYEELAVQEGERIMAEAAGKFSVRAAMCVHRVGRLDPGEIAVWVGVMAEHRAEAFDACRYIIDEVKARVPIWKKEHYADAPAEWVSPPAPRPRKTAHLARKRKTRRRSDSAGIPAAST
jgi:molybdopterin synthase catalytic subunit